MGRIPLPDALGKVRDHVAAKAHEEAAGRVDAELLLEPVDRGLRHAVDAADEAAHGVDAELHRQARELHQRSSMARTPHKPPSKAVVMSVHAVAKIAFTDAQRLENQVEIPPIGIEQVGGTREQRDAGDDGRDVSVR